MSRRELRLDSRRLALSTALAVAIHAGLFFGIPAILRLENRKTPEYGGTVVVQLEEPAPAVEEPAPEPSPQPVAAQPEPAPTPEPAPPPAPKPVPKPVPAPKAAPVLKATPAARTAPKAQVAAPAPAASTPVVKQPQATLPTGPAFREAGEKTGLPAPLPSAAPAGAVPKAQAVAGPDPTLPAAGTPRGGATAAGSVQRSGVGVAVPAQTTKPSGTTSSGSTASGLDLRALDKALASTGSAPGTGSPRVSPTTSAGSSDFSVVWDEPDAAKGRELLSAPLPKLPPRVQEEGLTLSMKVSFTVTPGGVVALARVIRSSGYADVDAAVLEAVRRWRFTSAETTRTVSGTIPYTIRAR